MIYQNSLGLFTATSAFLPLVTRFFEDDKDEKFVLHHGDLSLDNAIVDWKCVSLQLMWKARPATASNTLRPRNKT